MLLHPYMSDQMAASRRDDALATAERATLARENHRGVRRFAAPLLRRAGLRARRRAAVAAGRPFAAAHDNLAGCGC
jgi:hypothetical protein